MGSRRYPGPQHRRKGCRSMAVGVAIAFVALLAIIVGGVVS
jgi:hypothetical protein